MPRNLELLSPARDIAIAREAILHGADAIYIGGPTHGARASASNTFDDIATITDFAHLYGVKVYVTLNTIIYNDELKQVEASVNTLYDIGVDALIVQDMSLLRMDIPPIDLHASTQCDIRTPEKALFLARCGFSQLVLPRELSLEQMHEISKAVGDNVVLEAFVHGALCVSYSGDCQASCIAKGRSANRGECAQMCRLPYSLVDSRGNEIIRDKHLLSLRDLNRKDDLHALIEAGISSFKIEGRLKDEAYVKTTVAAYSQELNNIIANHPDEYRRTSYGETRITFDPDVNKVFNRGFTSYFTRSDTSSVSRLANLGTPKWVGECVGTVIKSHPRYIEARLDKSLNNGDGLGYFTAAGDYTGFHLNRAEGERLFPAQPVAIPSGTKLYRNRDVNFDKLMSQKTAQRLIPIGMSLSLNGNNLVLTLESENGIKATTKKDITIESAQTPQVESRKRNLSKLGGTPFYIKHYIDNLDDNIFIPASSLTRLRQEAVQNLQTALVNSYQRANRSPEDTSVQVVNKVLTYHDNVANRLAEDFYRGHGATSIEYALETSVPGKTEGLTVMTTKYCIRRELGACLKETSANKLPTPLYLRNGSTSYLIDFDCANCQMHIKVDSAK